MELMSTSTKVTFGCRQTCYQQGHSDITLLNWSVPLEDYHDGIKGCDNGFPCRLKRSIRIQSRLICDSNSECDTVLAFDLLP